jgi:hypothetical protein
MQSSFSVVCACDQLRSSGGSSSSREKEEVDYTPVGEPECIIGVTRDRGNV